MSSDGFSLSPGVGEPHGHRPNSLDEAIAVVERYGSVWRQDDKENGPVDKFRMGASQVYDEDLIHTIGKFKDLKHLELYNTDISDRTLRALEMLDNLQYLDLSGTDVTENDFRTTCLMWTEFKQRPHPLCPYGENGQGYQDPGGSKMATVDLKDPRVEPLVQEVEKKLRKLNEDSLERSFGGSGGGDSYFVWSRIKEIGKELEEIGGRNLVTAAINKIRREQTMMSEQLELTWLGKRISRLP